MSAAAGQDCGRPHRRVRAGSAHLLEHLAAAQLVGDATDPDDHRPLGRTAGLPRGNRPLAPQADDGPGWMAGRGWWFALGAMWGGLICGIALRLSS
jgi:hypothetical protein